jgi:hypothetical protein
MVVCITVVIKFIITYLLHATALTLAPQTASRAGPVDTPALTDRSTDALVVGVDETQAYAVLVTDWYGSEHNTEKNKYILLCWVNEINPHCYVKRAMMTNVTY